MGLRTERTGDRTQSESLIPAAGAGCLRTGHSGAGAHGPAASSPGVVSGNVVQVPVNIPVNVVGNTVNVVGLLNPPSATSA
ncbi:chaplin family protein [Streptomyces sp. M10(2022)]